MHWTWRIPGTKAYLKPTLDTAITLSGLEAMEAAMEKEGQAISWLCMVYGLTRFHLRTDDIEESVSKSLRADYYREIEESLRVAVPRGAKPRVCTCPKEAKGPWDQCGCASVWQTW